MGNNRGIGGNIINSVAFMFGYEKIVIIIIIISMCNLLWPLA